jgi:hypothetical protein
MHNPLFSELVKEPFFARKQLRRQILCILTKNSFKKDLNAEFVHPVFKPLKN